jgi:hypothetical protein
MKSLMSRDQGIKNYQIFTRQRINFQTVLMAMGRLSMLCLFGFTWSLQARAANYTDLAFEAGFRSQNGDITGAQTDAQMGYQFGVSAAFPVAEKFSLRTGFMYSQKNVKATVGSASSDYKFTFVEIPATAMVKFTESAGAYAGVALSLNMDDKCGSQTCLNSKSFLTPFLLGVAFKFAPQFGLNLYYEALNAKLATGVENFRAVGANLMVTFD